MSTVFSYIVQTKLSQEYENVATEALAFIVRTSDRARGGLIKLLRGIAPDLSPNLQFRTQLTEGEARPDMGGFDDAGTRRVLIENKFWAGLTENQPVEYLRKLAKTTDGPVLLLMVVPEARVELVWGECNRLLTTEGATPASGVLSAGVVHAETIDLGPDFAIQPIFAITSWARLLSAIGADLTDEHTKNDLAQLRALSARGKSRFRPCFYFAWR